MKKIEIKPVAPEDYIIISNLEVEHSIKHSVSEALNLGSTGMAYVLVVDDVIEGYVVFLRTMSYWVFSIYEIVFSKNVSVSEAAGLLESAIKLIKVMGCLEVKYYVNDYESFTIEALETSGFTLSSQNDGISLYIKNIPVL